jgi:poly-gamma-glutamate capsule biosynthesis protein CapA/YwtB (metallophosphatase superfamily)
MGRVFPILLCVSVVLAGCAFGPQRSTRLDSTSSVTVNVVDEAGRPVNSATYDFNGTSLSTDSDGRLEISINGPVSGTIDAPGMLPEPVVLAPRDDDVRVTLFSREGPSGRRDALHFGGDVMLGRRYQTPARSSTAVAKDTAGARAVVSELAQISSVADATVVNLETVIGALPEDKAKAGKRYVLQSPPEVLDTLDALGVDMVTLGNNHINDWNDLGVESTIDFLDEAGMPSVGAGLTRSDAVRGEIIPLATREIGVVSVTTINGDFVNNHLPTAADFVPDDLPPSEAWQYDVRTFGFGQPGDPSWIPLAERRAGEAWSEYLGVERGLDAEAAATLWTAITADDAYPELQDAIARRGHGGAAGYDRAEVAAEIERLRSEGAELVVVQLHAGFQFAQATSGFIRRVSHRAVDDGADMVISHHPHVLQGIEWYNDRLIAYSLGNLVFDQDFLASFSSALLRVIVDDDGLVEVRALPIMLIDYRPVPVAGDAAERIIRLLDTRSALPAESERVDEFLVGTVLVDEIVNGVEPATVEFDRNSGVVRRGRAETAVTLQAGPQATASVPPCLTLSADRLPEGVEYGVDLFGWGRFDDMAADGDRGDPMHWVTPDLADNWSMVQGASPDPNDDALQIITDANRSVSVRFAARSPLVAHRLYDSDLGHPADGNPSYTLEFDTDANRSEGVTIRLDVHNVVNADPTKEPASVLLRSVEIPIDVESEDGWRSHIVPIEPAVFAPPDDLSSNAVMVTVIAEPAFRGKVSIDNFRLLEWRPAPVTTLPMWTEVDALRAAESQRFEVTVSGCRNV